MLGEMEPRWSDKNEEGGEEKAIQLFTSAFRSSPKAAILTVNANFGRIADDHLSCQLVHGAATIRCISIIIL
jgi:hypothetical protein